MVWDRRPYLEHLEGVLDEGERVGLLLFDARRARLFTLYLGHLTEHQSFADEVPKRQQGGGWATLRQTRYARHREDRLLRHVRRAAAALLALHRDQPFDRLLLAGPDEAVTLLRHHLPGSLRQRLAGTLRLELFAGQEEILAAARSKVGELERQGDAALVDELIGSATTAHVVLGASPTLAALAEGRVHHLVVADTFHPQGSECPACGHLDRLAGACAACGGPTQPVADLGERAVELALDQGAKVEIVSGDAASLLAVHGGIGAWVRY
jgi:peptide chain release factor subunit 1